MKKSVFTLLALCILHFAFCTSVSAQSTSDRTSFYLLPEGSFYAGMTSSAGLSTAITYMPCYGDSSHVYRSTTGAGDWLTGSTVKATNTETYDFKIWINYSSTNVPVLTCPDKRPYQYGTKSSTKKLYSAYGSYALMTNAREWCDTVSKASGQALTFWASYKTSAEEIDTLGAFFYNSHPMMVRGVSLPISSNTTGQTVDDLFPNENSHVTVNIYAAKATPKGDGTYTRSLDRSRKLVETFSLYKKDFSVNSSTAYRGALNYTFPQPFLTSEPFVVEVSDYSATCGAFYFYADNYCKNYTSYYMKHDTLWTMSKGNLLFSVSAYFPAALPMVKELTTPAIASTASVQMYGNTKYSPDNWTVLTPEWVESYTVDTVGGNASKPVFTFTVKENTQNEARTDTIWLEMLGFKSYVLLTQNRPQTFIMPIGAAKEGVAPSEGGAVTFGGAEELLLLTNITSAANVQYSFPSWMTGTLEVIAADTLRITATVAKNTTADLSDNIAVWGEDADTLYIPVSQAKWFAYVKTGYSETGFSFPGKGGAMKFEHYTNTEMFMQSNVPYTEWQITKPDWITDVLLHDTIRNGVPNVSMILYAAVNMGGARSDSITIRASEESYLRFGLTQDSLIRSAAYYTVDNCFYRGFGPKRASYTTPYIFVPYQDSVAVRVDAAGVGSWYSNGKLQDENTDIYYVGPLVQNVNKYVLYMPEFHPNDSLVYTHFQYGGKYYSKSRIRYGYGKKDYLCSASVYADTTETASKGQGYWQRGGTISGVSYDYSYGTGLGEGDARYDTIGQFIPISDVLTFDTMFVAIYNKAKEGKEAIFGENGKVTMSIYYAELDATGVPEIDRENPLAVMVADSNMWMPSDNYPYYGTLVFHNLVTNKLGIESVKPIVAEKSIYCEFTGFNETGMNFGFYSDGYTNIKPNAWFTKNGKQTKVWGTQHNLFITLYGFFPMMVNWDDIEGLTVAGEGGEAQVSDTISVFSLRANRNYTEWDVEAPDWVSISYEDIQYEDNNTVAISVQADAATEAREGDIIFSNNGKAVTIHISQASPVSGLVDLYDKPGEGVQKLIRNGRLYIIRGGKTYDAIGQLAE